jgi:hypothetical protein
VHVVPLAHTFPQLPQLMFVVMLVQTPLQAALPAEHVQTPLAQLAPTGHVFPHVPQFEMLVIVSTHDAPHWVSDPQPEAQVPALHTSPEAQT